jgi:hypothetical protein
MFKVVYPLGSQLNCVNSIYDLIPCLVQLVLPQ